MSLICRILRLRAIQLCSYVCNLLASAETSLYRLCSLVSLETDCLDYSDMWFCRDCTSSSDLLKALAVLSSLLVSSWTFSLSSSSSWTRCSDSFKISCNALSNLSAPPCRTGALSSSFPILRHAYEQKPMPITRLIIASVQLGHRKGTADLYSWQSSCKFCSAEGLRSFLDVKSRRSQGASASPIIRSDTGISSTGSGYQRKNRAQN